MTDQNSARSNKKHLIPFSVLLLTVTLLAIYLYGWNPEKEQQKKSNRPPTPVRIEVINEGVFIDSIEAIGTTFAREAVNITAKKSGIVDQIFFEDGEEIKKGTTLITLRNEEEKAKVLESQTRLAEDKRQLERLHNLKKSQATARSAFEEQESKVKESEAQLKVAEAQHNELIIKAPFDGVLGIRKVSPGSLVSPGTMITTLDDLELIKVDFSVPETFLSTLSKGQIIIAKSSAWPELPFEGIVSNINSRIDPITRAVNIRAEISNKNKRLRPGMLLVITLIKNQGATIMVPESALLPIESRQYLYKLEDDNKVSKIEVTSGRRNPGKVEIIKGVSVGDKIIVEGVLRLQDGSAVRVINGVDNKSGAKN